MFQQCESLADLMAALDDDRCQKGVGASTRDRFPVRLLLFDNFRDCCSFIEEQQNKISMTFVSIDKWMDEEYPDTLITHTTLERKIRETIHGHSSEHLLITPLSELARFYDNSEPHFEFNALIGTIRGIEATTDGVDFHQRVYVPIIGLESKTERFREQSQSFIYYFHNSDRQLNYRLVLTNNTTYGVHDVERHYNIAPTVTEWLRCWRYPELKPNIICTSSAIFANAGHAQPDNAFSYCICYNAYQFIHDALNVKVPQCEYREEDRQYWEQLATEISIEDFDFDNYFTKRFGIYELTEYSSFYRLWFDNNSSFDRWLISMYYRNRVCEKGYICRVLATMDDYATPRFLEQIALQIFTLEDEAYDYIEERKSGMEEALRRGVVLSPTAQSILAERLQKVAERDGVATALRFFTHATDVEKRLVIEWYNNGHIVQTNLKLLYPDLYYYLANTQLSSEVTWVTQYFEEYKYAKLAGVYSKEMGELISSVNESESSFHDWYDRFSTVKTVMSGRTDINVFFWIDGLGLDWVPLIQQVVKERENDGYYLNEVLVARAKLPTRTKNNKEDLQQLGGVLLEKIGDLDSLAHTVREYPQYIIDDIAAVRKAINTVLDAHPKQKIAIVSDHGMTYLSQMVDGRNLKGIDSDHYGRCAGCKKGIVADEYYLRINEGKELVALRHNSLSRKVAEGTGAHGGATPEETLVPIIVISDKKESRRWTARQITTSLNASNPIFEVAFVGLQPNETPSLLYNRENYKLRKEEANYRSERLELDPDVKQVTVIVGLHSETFDVELQMAVKENDIMDF
ncbi:MAG: BREX-4 system phosphatase PglZ [Bacteroidales bacterium]|nr:BREX-4 system phosphatase PglZ [Bacteroidales bacterium]